MNPEPWEDFMKSFINFIAGFFSSIGSILGISDDKPSSPPQTPTTSRLADIGNAPSRLS
jgi:hypothetical protein